MNAAFDITLKERKTLLDLLRRFIPDVEVWAYGSRVKWTARPNSDLDLVVFSPPALKSQVTALKEALDESNLPFLVDLHIWDEVPERFREIIRQQYVVLQPAKEKQTSGVMAGEDTIKLREVCVKIGSGATPRGGKEAYKGGATSLIRSQNIYNEGFHRDGLVYIDDNQSSELKNVEVMPNDVLLNITGDSVARCCQVAEDVLPARVNQYVAIIRPQSDSLNAQFLRYVLVSQEYQSRLLALASAGATRPALTKAMIEELDVPSLPLPEQKAIANVLGSLDDKIELNRRMNATLEAMARALFQSWFVDFDPVRAKLDGRKPLGLDPKTAALFPNSFQDSPLGPIPKGWSVGSIKDCCIQIQNGGTPRRNEPRFWDGGAIPWLASGEVRQSIITATESFITEAGLAESSAKWVPAYSTVIALYGATAGQVSIISSQLTTNQAVCALVPKKDFAFFNYLTMRAATTELENKAVGSAQQNISKGIVEETQVILPPTSLVEEFAATVEPLFEHWIANLHQSRTLAAIRDTLLPKLLSGEVRVAVKEVFHQDG